jgi:hypothetical protein
MRALALLALCVAAVAPVASAQTIGAPRIQASANAGALQRIADQRWSEVLARDAAFMRAVRAAMAAEIRARRARGEDLTELQRELDLLAADANMSFNMQYLMLQQSMQDENRRFTLLSNIMKTKHDTAENSISNVR